MKCLRDIKLEDQVLPKHTATSTGIEGKDGKKRKREHEKTNPKEKKALKEQRGKDNAKEKQERGEHCKNACTSAKKLDSKELVYAHDLNSIPKARTYMKDKVCILCVFVSSHVICLWYPSHDHPIMIVNYLGGVQS